MLEPLKPTIIHPNGDLEYIARAGKLLLQVDTNLSFKRAYEKAHGRHHEYLEIDDPAFNQNK